jgi:DNA-3-methyladenine glycosylase
MLPLSYYQQNDVLAISQQLLGKFLFTDLGGTVTGGMIVETEAYRGPEDKASHAFGLRRTNRNSAMYNTGGCVYVYICYGLYPLLNVVTNQAEIPHAILIRALEPTEGIETMLQRRNKTKVDYTLTAGPGALAIALGITKNLNGLLLTGPEIWIENRDRIIAPEQILASPRVGIDYAGEDAKLPWRFRIHNHPFTSRAK